jgi:hypothetical protein
VHKPNVHKPNVVRYTMVLEFGGGLTPKMPIFVIASNRATNIGQRICRTLESAL